MVMREERGDEGDEEERESMRPLSSFISSVIYVLRRWFRIFSHSFQNYFDEFSTKVFPNKLSEVYLYESSFC